MESHVGGICLLNKTYPIMLWNFRVVSKHSCDFFVSEVQSCNPIISETVGHLLTHGSQADPENARNPPILWMMKKFLNLQWKEVPRLTNTVHLRRYCWWTKSCTTKDDDYPTVYRVLTIPGGAGFCPSTVWHDTTSSMQYPKWCQGRSPLLILGSLLIPPFCWCWILIFLEDYLWTPQQPMEKWSMGEKKP